MKYEPNLKLKSILTLRQKTYEDMAIELKITIKTFYNKINGKADVSGRQYKQMAKGLEVTIDEII